MKKPFAVLLFIFFGHTSFCQLLQQGAFSAIVLETDVRPGYPVAAGCNYYEFEFYSNCLSLPAGLNLYLRIDEIRNSDSIMLWRGDFGNRVVYAGDTIPINVLNTIYVYYYNTDTLYTSLIAVGTPQNVGDKYYCNYSKLLGVWSDGCANLFTSFSGGNGALDTVMGCSVLPDSLLTAPCNVHIIANGPTSFCQGDSVQLIALTQSDSSILDQSQLDYNSGTSARNLPGYSEWQSFTAGISGTLDEIDIGFFNAINGVGIINIYDGEGTAGTLLQTQTVSVVCAAGNCLLPFSVNAPVIAGHIYSFQFIPGTGIVDPYGVQAVNPGTYSNGQMAIVDPSGTSFPGFDMVFKTHVTTHSYLLWSNGSTNSSFRVANSGIYTVTVTDSSGCSSYDSIQINVNAPPVINLGNDTSICIGCSLVLNAGNGFAHYYWSTGDSTNSITADSAGTYDVEVLDSMGCVGFDTIQISTLLTGMDNLESSISINIYPNPASEEVLLSFPSVQKAALSIYDLFGEKILSKQVIGSKIYTDISQLPPGTYILIINVSGITIRRSLVKAF